MTSQRLKSLGLLAPLLACMLGLILFLWNPLPLQVARNTVFDQFQRWQPRTYTGAQVRIISIDEESIQRLGQWPWPRSVMADLTQRLQAASPSAIAFDLLFTEGDRTAPKAMVELWRAPEPLRELLSHLPDHDAQFAQALGQGKVALGFAVNQAMDITGSSALANPIDKPVLQTIKAPIVAIGESALSYVHSFSQSVAAIPQLQSPAEGSGALAFIPDSDGVVRRVPMLVRVGDQLLPTLAAEAMRLQQGAKNYVTRSAATHGVGLEDVRIGQLLVPTTEKGEVWLHYSPAQAERYIPAWQVLAGQVPASALGNKILFVGATAQGLMDLRFSALGKILPGVEVHAQLIEQVLSGASLQRPSWAFALESVGLVVTAAGIGWIALVSPAVISFCAFAVVLMAIWAAAWWAFSAQGLLLDAVLPSLAVASSFVLASIVHHLVVEKRQDWIRQAFSRYVSPNLVAHLVDHPGALELGGKRQQCSFVFTDLAGFTGLMEKMDAADAVTVLNVYLDRMIAIAFSHQGTLDRVVGDAVAIMFSAPLEQPDHQRRALACALEMHQFASDYEKEMQARGINFCETRIGVHTGEVIVGNFGGAAIFDYRALGDPVNTASRLEAANKRLGTLVCVSEATLAGCLGAAVRPVGRLLLPGKTQALRVFEPLLDSSWSAEDVTAYKKAFELVQLETPAARTAFEELRRRHPKDALVRLHADRLAAGEVGDLIVMAQK